MAKLMLVEDDNNLREIYEARLQAEGYTIVSARDGEEALTVAKAEKPDLIISDVMMPKISGFEMLDILRNTDGLKHIQIIMLTALGQSDDQQRANNLGADRYLVKSQVTLEDIVKVTHELLEDGGEPAAPAAAVPTPEAPAASAPPPAPVSVAAPPAPMPDPTPATDASQAVDSTTPQSEASESAVVEEQIENFVAGATSDAGGPPQTQPADSTPVPEPSLAPAPEPAPAPTPEPAPEPAAQPPAADPGDNGGVQPQTTDDKPAGAPADTPSEQADKEKAADQAEPVSENVTVAHKKVIQPPADVPKKDIDTLLAEEQAKAAADNPAAVNVVTGEGTPKTEGSDGKNDPRNIAL